MERQQFVRISRQPMNDNLQVSIYSNDDDDGHYDIIMTNNNNNNNNS